MKLVLQKKCNRSNGFTLVETLVAIGILMTALAAPLSIAQVGMRTAHFARDSLTAQMLAVEGIEYVRNLRDENFLTDTQWTQGLRMNSGEYLVDAVHENESNCSGDCSDDYLYFNSSSKLYGHQGGPDWEISRFARAVRVDRVNNHEIQVTVTVWWARANEDYSFSTREHLFNWYE